MKKFFAFLLTFAMLFSLAMPAMAAEPTINGNTTGDVSAYFDPGEIKITGMEYYGEEATYDADTNTYTVVIPAGTTSSVPVGVKLIGTNLDLANGSTHLQLKEITSFMGEYIYTTEELIELEFTPYWETRVDGYWATYQYSNDDGVSWSDEILKVEVKHGYSVTVNESENGSVTADKSLVAPGDTVSLNVSPAENYGLNELTVTDAEGNPVTVKNNSFTMPASAVEVSATFKYTEPHDITVNNSDNGTVTADLDEATAGTTVTLTVNPDEGYELDALTVNDGAVEVTKVDDTSYTFEMPEGDAAVSATFKKINYTITIDSAIVNGTVTAPANATIGDNVILTVEAVAQYELDSLKVTRSDTGEEVTVTDKTFTMPAANVTVTATFKELPITSVTISWGSMSFVYDDTIADGATTETGWTCAAGANQVTVTNGNESAITASVEYKQEIGYEAINGYFAAESATASADLDLNEAHTFTLTLSGKPNKALDGETIGTVTVEIESAADTT